jgi:hypothetical protein
MELEWNMLDNVNRRSDNFAVSLSFKVSTVDFNAIEVQ